VNLRDHSHFIRRYLGIIAISFLPVSPSCLAQTMSKVVVTESIKKWERVRSVQVDDEAQAAVATQVGKIVASKPRGFDLTENEYNGAISASTFLLLDTALKSRTDAWPSGSPTSVQKLDLKSLNFGPAPAPAFWGSAGGFGFLIMSSTPSKAEIYVDGQFQGYTVSTLGLSVGRHIYQIKNSTPLPRMDCKGELNVEKGKTYEESCPTKALSH
jgi:hypothetical protein